MLCSGQINRSPHHKPHVCLATQEGPATSLLGTFFFFNFFKFLSALGLCCCMRAFSSCGEWGLLFVAVRGFLITVASLVVEHRL